MTHNDTRISQMPNSPHWLIVDGDLVPTGGMDIANLRLAEYLAEFFPLHIVTHRADAALSNRPNVHLQMVARPLNAHILGGFLLDIAGRRAAHSQKKKGTLNVVVNGGNCVVPEAINWVHYVHAAYEPENHATGLRRFKNRLHRYQSLRSERSSLIASRIVICNSELTAKHVREKLSVPADRIRVVYYGIDNDRFFPASNEERVRLRTKLGWHATRRKILFIGALGDRRKGFDTVAKAWEQLCNTPEWDVDLLVVGSGAQKSQWQSHFDQLGLKSRVEFLGFRSDVPDLLRAADALIAPTRYEAYGLGVHEAICCGLPAFVSRDSGVAERYPVNLEERLLISNPDDVQEVVQRFVSWRSDTCAFQSLMKSFSDDLRARSWRDMAQEFVEAAG